ncbi:endoglucanase IV precursor [Pestalotiopsis sp. NC0098]|nr:endoglucanase IV precursor [Pestalotiopsis sp. NC0098]
MVEHTALSSVAILLTNVAVVNAHGYVKNIVVNGVSYQGYDPTTFPYQSNPPIVVGWTTSQTDLGYVDPTAFGAPDIICHRTARPAGGHVRVAAGDSVALTWNTWPDSHHGPILDYLAACGGDGLSPCEAVDKTALRFFKIDGAGKADPAATASPGYWADDVMMANGLTWLVRIPPTTKPGNYVLRHEIIALHSANQVNGAQAYPQCFNLEIVNGTGTSVPAGVLGTELYKNTDPGILYNLYTTPQPSYTVPGPALIAGASSSAAQSSSVITASGSATVGYTSTSSSSTSTATTSSSTRVTTATSTSVTSSSSKTTTTASSISTPAMTTTTTTSARTSSSSSSSAASSTAAMPSQNLVPLYQQCGGKGWGGGTECAPTHVGCQSVNEYYSQCTLVAG